MKNLLHSFKYAFHGLWDSLNERNMRIHIVAMVTVLLFSLLFDLTSGEYCILILTIASVMAAELFNTAIEAITDLASPNRHVLARIAKDTAAAGVLLLSIAAVIIAVFIFWDKDVFNVLYNFFSFSIWVPIAVFVYIIVCCIFIFSAKKKRKKNI